MVQRLIAPCLLASLCLGCATTTQLHSNPEGARLYLDGIYEGVTPVTMTLTDGMDNGYKHVRLEKDGYGVTELAMGRKQSNARIIAGYFCLFPLLWAYAWDADYTFNLPREGDLYPPPRGGVSPTAPKTLEPGPTESAPQL